MCHVEFGSCLKFWEFWKGAADSVGEQNLKLEDTQGSHEFASACAPALGCQFGIGFLPRAELARMSASDYGRTLYTTETMQNARPHGLL